MWKVKSNGAHIQFWRIQSCSLHSKNRFYVIAMNIFWPFSKFVPFTLARDVKSILCTKFGETVSHERYFSKFVGQLSNAL